MSPAHHGTATGVVHTLLACHRTAVGSCRHTHKELLLQSATFTKSHFYKVPVLQRATFTESHFYKPGLSVCRALASGSNSRASGI
eukprot:352484-Chlamydomonas_euryale.AAC.3